jgi:hypothetical protein
LKFIEKIIFHIKLSRHFEFTRKKISMTVLLAKVNNKKRKNWQIVIFENIGGKIN